MAAAGIKDVPLAAKFVIRAVKARAAFTNFDRLEAR
jgi:hypothetical protein